MKLRITATSRMSRVGAISLAEEFGYVGAEARAEQFLAGKPFEVTIEQQDAFLVEQWRKEYRVKVEILPS